MWKGLVVGVSLVAACGGGGKRDPLPPAAPMPAGPGWIGAWSTDRGALALQATPPDVQDAAKFPIIGKATFARGGAPVEYLVMCAVPTDNHLHCFWEEMDRQREVLAMMTFVMNPDGESFVADWHHPDGTARFHGTRAPSP